MFLVEVLKNTPIYVWIIFILLIKRGLSAAKDGMISFPKMLIMPAIFVVWGLDKLLVHFPSIGISLSTYLLLACAGTIAGYALYARFRRIYIKDDILYKSGTYLPLVIIVVNFSIKYCLSVWLAINPALYDNLSFSIFYAALSGFSVGLFFGGILQVFRQKSLQIV